MRKFKSKRKRMEMVYTDKLDRPYLILSSYLIVSYEKCSSVLNGRDYTPDNFPVAWKSSDNSRHIDLLPVTVLNVTILISVTVLISTLVALNLFLEI